MVVEITNNAAMIWGSVASAGLIASTAFAIGAYVKKGGCPECKSGLVVRKDNCDRRHSEDNMERRKIWRKIDLIYEWMATGRIVVRRDREPGSPDDTDAIERTDG
jgi:hypothetical protein